MTQSTLDPAADTRPANPRPPGHDAEALGPSDSSDSGSDVAGGTRAIDLDPDAPVDVATRDDSVRPTTSARALRRRGTSDAGGTGERGSATVDEEAPDGADIAPDRQRRLIDDDEVLDEPADGSGDA